MQAGAKIRRGARRGVTYAIGGFPSLVTPKRFVVFTTGRSGSELLVELLTSHPDVVCDGELFREPARWPRRLVRGRSVLAARRGAHAHGFKLLLMHMRWFSDRIGSPHQFLAELADEHVDIIYLRRRNLLAHAVSLAQAEQTRYHWRRHDLTAFEPVVIDPADVLTHLAIVESDARLAAEMIEDLDHISLTYEGDLAEPAARQRTLDRLSLALGVTQSPTSSHLVRITPTCIADRVKNFDELAAAVADTKFAPMLYEPS